MEDLLGTALRETVERACRGWPRSKNRSRRPQSRRIWCLPEDFDRDRVRLLHGIVGGICLMGHFYPKLHVVLGNE